MLQRSLRSILFLGLTLLIALTYSHSSARADGLLVFPPSGMPGTTFQIQGSGFNANEGVELWSRYPDGRTLQLSSATADGNGAVSFKVSTDSTFPLGSYLLVAHGKSSGTNSLGNLTIGSAGAGNVVTGTAFCQGQTFSVPGFVPGETVVFTVQFPDGSVQVLGTPTADGSGNASFSVPLQPGLPIGAYIITAQGLASGHKTSDTLNFDGNTLSGSNCSISVSGSLPGGYSPGPIPKIIINYQGPGVYLGNEPTGLPYFGCGWKWRSFGGVIYFLVLGFKPYEPVRVSHEILLVQGMTYDTTISADAYGNAAYAVDSTFMTRGHYHWWFTSPSASYCGHYDLP